MKFFSSDAANLMLAAMIKMIAIPDASWYFPSPRKRGFFFHWAEIYAWAPVSLRSRHYDIIPQRTCMRTDKMKNDFDEKMTEIIIGEAVTALLDASAAVSWSALLVKLHSALDAETDEHRIRAGLRAIEEVRKEMMLNTQGVRDTGAATERSKMH